MCNEEKDSVLNETPAEDPGNTEASQDAAPEEQLSEIDLLRGENEAIIKELEEYKDKYLRLMAEYDNFRKRSQKEKLEIYPEAFAKAVEAFLPLADNFERAAFAETADEKYKSGVMMIYTQLQEAFKSLGVETIDRTGEQFDPNLENAVATVSDDKLGENTVAVVYQKGYKRGDKVIRPAMVAVANC